MATEGSGLRIDLDAPETPHGRSPRSRFQLPGLGGALAFFSCILVAAGIAMLWSRGPGASPDLVTLAKESTLIDERVLLFPRERIALVHHEGQILALSLRNPHMGHRIQFCSSSGWFEDPAHGEKFDILGYHRAGPAPRGMDRHPVVLDRGAVMVDMGVRIQGPPRGTGMANEPEGRFCVHDGSVAEH